MQADLDEAKKVVAARDQAKRREVEARLRDQKRDSDRCRAQQAGTSKAVQDDC